MFIGRTCSSHLHILQLDTLHLGHPSVALLSIAVEVAHRHHSAGVSGIKGLGSIECAREHLHEVALGKLQVVWCHPFAVGSVRE